MISTDFAPNESWDDAWTSLKLLFQPWRWKKGEEIEEVKKQVLKQLTINNQQLSISLFLSGRSTLYNVLKSFKLSKNSEVIIQAFTCEAVVLPILALGLKPIYIDIETDTFSLNIRELTNKLTNKSKVLILQHTFGLTPKFRDKILKHAHDHKLIVIEDLAHGFNPSIFRSPNYQLYPSYAGLSRLAGSKQLRGSYTRANSFASGILTNNYYLLSFGRSKAISSVFGGAIVATNNLTIQQFNNLAFPSYWFIFRCLLYKPLAMLIKSTYDFYLGKMIHKLLNSLNLLIPEITAKEKKGDFDSSLNKAYPNCLTILLLHQFKKFDQMRAKRERLVRYYNQHYKTINDQQLTINSSLIRFPLLVKNRDETIDKLKKQNIFLGAWYDQAVAPKGIPLDRVGYRNGSCPIAEGICRKIINLPTNISSKEAERVMEILQKDLATSND